MSEPTVYRIAGVQTDPRIGEVARNREVILGRLEGAAALGARLVVFPECALTGYGFESKAGAGEFAEPVDGPSCRAVAAECARLGVWTVFGFLESEGERLY